MSRLLTAVIAGLLFGLGLAISGMVNPWKVLAFLDVAGTWDPSLAVTMAAALLVATPMIWWTRRRGRSLDLQPLPVDTVPTARIDRPLLVGSGLFGIGWGLSGYCPGAALGALAGGRVGAAVFVLAMLAGALAITWWTRTPRG